MRGLSLRKGVILFEIGEAAGGREEIARLVELSWILKEPGLRPSEAGERYVIWSPA